jgi:hypothetical protein
VAHNFHAGFGGFSCIGKFHVLILVSDMVPDIAQGVIASPLIGKKENSKVESAPVYSPDVFSAESYGGFH